jgi:dihydroxyacetone kinase-like protein
MIDVASMRAALARMHAGIGPIRDALNAADRELGDGDTGMTVEQLVDVGRPVAPSLPDDVGEALRRLGRNAAWSSVAAIALAAAGKAITGRARSIARIFAARWRRRAKRSPRARARHPETRLSPYARAHAAELEGSPSDAWRRDQGAQSALDELRDRECRVGPSHVRRAHGGPDTPACWPRCFCPRNAGGLVTAHLVAKTRLLDAQFDPAGCEHFVVGRPPTENFDATTQAPARASADSFGQPATEAAHSARNSQTTCEARQRTSELV